MSQDKSRVQVSFTRREIAQLIDAYRFIQQADPETRKHFGLSDKKIQTMLFKLWRVLDNSKNILC